MIKKHYLFLVFFCILNDTTLLAADKIYPHDLPTQPKVFFHGSHDRTIKEFIPRSISPRSESEGDVVFSTPHLAFATVFYTSP